jgi:hypothetical protein
MTDNHKFSSRTSVFCYLFFPVTPDDLQLIVAAPSQLVAPLDLDPESDVKAPRPSVLQLLPSK